jgi:hypothetical protein
MSALTRAMIAAFLGTLATSAGIMLWAFWRFPLITAVVALALFAGLCVLVRLAPLIDFDSAEVDDSRTPYWLVGDPRQALLSDAKAAEDLTEQVVAGELTGDFSKGKLRSS